MYLAGCLIKIKNVSTWAYKKVARIRFEKHAIFAIVIVTAFNAILYLRYHTIK